MRTIIEIDDATQPATLRMFIHNAPHRRAHRAILIAYRKELWKAWKAAGHSDTLDMPVDLHVTFINPTGPDLDNLLTALFQALDGKTGKGPTILADDRLISYVAMRLLRS
jgi:hypothetical protein